MFKRFAFIVAVIFAFAISAQSQTIARISKTVYLPGTSLPNTNATVTIFRQDLPGYSFANVRVVLARANSSGVLTSTEDGLPGFNLPWNARVWLYGNFTGLANLSANPSTGSEYEVPTGQSTISLDDLRPLTGVLRTKGDLVVSGTGGVAYRFGKCTDGYVMVADSTQTLGWRCDAAAGGSGGEAIYYYNSAASYARTNTIAYIANDATTAAQAVDLGTPSGQAVEVFKTDTTTNTVTVTYGASTLVLRYTGAWAKFLPNGSQWVLWSFDPTSGGVGAEDGYVYVSSSTYTVVSGVGYVDCDATSNAITITAGTPDMTALEVRKSDTSTNACTINYNSTSLTLTNAGSWAKFVPYSTNWVLLSRTQ